MLRQMVSSKRMPGIAVILIVLFVISWAVWSFWMVPASNTPATPKAATPVGNAVSP